MRTRIHGPHLCVGGNCPAWCILDVGTVVVKAQNSISLSLRALTSFLFSGYEGNLAEWGLWESQGGCDEAISTRGPPFLPSSAAAKEPLRPFFAISASYLSKTEPLENSIKAMRNFHMCRSTCQCHVSQEELTRCLKCL